MTFSFSVHIFLFPLKCVSQIFLTYFFIQFEMYGKAGRFVYTICHCHWCYKSIQNKQSQATKIPRRAEGQNAKRQFNDFGKNWNSHNHKASQRIHEGTFKFSLLRHGILNGILSVCVCACEDKWPYIGIHEMKRKIELLRSMWNVSRKKYLFGDHFGNELDHLLDIKSFLSTVLLVNVDYARVLFVYPFHAPCARAKQNKSPH